MFGFLIILRDSGEIAVATAVTSFNLTIQVPGDRAVDAMGEIPVLWKLNK